jgi:hypothetical protein
MRIVYITAETDAQIDRTQFKDGDWQSVANARERKAREITAGLNAPIDLSTVVAVAHDAKSDRYTARFTGGEKTLTLKVTDEVAAFIAEHLRAGGSWRGRMEKGVLVDAYLISLNLTESR